MALHSNDSLLHGVVVTTAKGSSAILVFSSGSTVSIEPDSKVVIDEFTQDPFPAEVTLADAREEPATSHLKLTLPYGELVGNIKNLKGPSTLSVQTPAGMAFVSGTTFRLGYRPADNGQSLFELGVTSGTVIFLPLLGVPLPVRPGQEVQAKVATNPITQAVESEPVTKMSIPDGTSRTIEEQIIHATEALGVTVFPGSELFDLGPGPRPLP